jgi:ribonuclease P protein component
LLCVTMRLPRSMRIRNRSEFQRSRKGGKSYPGRFVVLSVLRDEGLGTCGRPPFRFGIILTRKVGNAVTRNRVRRQIRSLLSKHGASILPGFQLVLIARYTAPTAGFEALEKDWLKLLRRAGIIDRQQEGCAGG